MVSGFFRYIPDAHGIGEASQAAAEAADGKIAEVAQSVLEAAQRIARAEGLDDYAANLRIDTGARPKGRGYRRVIADDPSGEAHEWGDTDEERLRILGRASGVQVFPDTGDE